MLLEASRDLDRCAINPAFVQPHLTTMDADPEAEGLVPDSVVRCRTGSLLKGTGKGQSRVSAGEEGEERITPCVNQPAAKRADQRLRARQRELQGSKSSQLVDRHQPAVALDVRE